MTPVSLVLKVKQGNASSACERHDTVFTMLFWIRFNPCLLLQMPVLQAGSFCSKQRKMPVSQPHPLPALPGQQATPVQCLVHIRAQSTFHNWNVVGSHHCLTLPFVPVVYEYKTQQCSVWLLPCDNQHTAFCPVYCVQYLVSLSAWEIVSMECVLNLLARPV